MTDKQKLFIQEYIATKFNATQAAINAGYSEKTARSIGQENLTKPDIKKAIDRAINAELVAVGVNKRDVIREIALCAFVDAANYYNKNGSLKSIKDLKEEHSRAIASMDVIRRKSGDDQDIIDKIKFHSKLTALELLGKHLDVFGKPFDVSDIQGVVILPQKRIHGEPVDYNNTDDNNATPK